MSTNGVLRQNELGSVVRRGLVIASLAALAALAVASDVPLCPLATWFGIPCPGCGLTRATLSLLHGDVHAALHFHPLVFVLSPAYFGVLGAAAVNYVRGPSQRAMPSWVFGRAMTRIAWALSALVLGVWIARFFGAFGGPVPVRSIALPAWLWLRR